MAADEILKLFDSYWYEYNIFTGNKSSASSTLKSLEEDHHEAEISNNSRVTTSSDPCVRVENASSPRSVITAPKILSGKLAGQQGAEESKASSSLVVRSLSDRWCLRADNGGITEDVSFPSSDKAASRLPKIISVEEKGIRETPKRKGSKGISRSLSDLEIKELKGFMDLGFVFTEEDKTSSLASILPGLQRWGEDAGKKLEKEGVVSRPYLSEAWGAMGQRKITKTVVPWSFPAVKNDITMKDHLKAWAHTVASTVR